jgi:L-ascorbate metabolism protein UlaG (beta-lactamase superfamily)
MYVSDNLVSQIYTDNPLTYIAIRRFEISYFGVRRGKGTSAMTGSNGTLIEWYGHAYTRIVTSSGVKIIIDPHDGGSLNLPEFRVDADLVLISHDHYDHNAVEMITLNSGGKIFSMLRGELEPRGVKITGVKTFHDKAMGALRGENTIHIIHTDNIKIAHLGDLGHIPDENTISLLKETDVLMIPVGGVYTIDAYEAWTLIEILSPKIVIPLHFWLPYSTVPLDPLEKFLNISKARRLRIEDNRLNITRSSLPEKTTIVIFSLPKR